jgi:hypothetical protein
MFGNCVQDEVLCGVGADVTPVIYRVRALPAAMGVFTASTS